VRGGTAAQTLQPACAERGIQEPFVNTAHLELLDPSAKRCAVWRRPAETTGGARGRTGRVCASWAGLGSSARSWCVRRAGGAINASTRCRATRLASAAGRIGGRVSTTRACASRDTTASDARRADQTDTDTTATRCAVWRRPAETTGGARGRTGRVCASWAGLEIDVSLRMVSVHMLILTVGLIAMVLKGRGVGAGPRTRHRMSGRDRRRAAATDWTRIRLGAGAGPRTRRRMSGRDRRRAAATDWTRIRLGAKARTDPRRTTGKTLLLTLIRFHARRDTLAHWKVPAWNANLDHGASTEVLSRARRTAGLSQAPGHSQTARATLGTREVDWRICSHHAGFVNQEVGATGGCASSVRQIRRLRLAARMLALADVLQVSVEQPTIAHGVHLEHSSMCWVLQLAPSVRKIPSRRHPEQHTIQLARHVPVCPLHRQAARRQQTVSAHLDSQVQSALLPRSLLCS